MDDFENYSKNTIHFFTLQIPPLLRWIIEKQSDEFKFVDLGCGDGNIVYALKNSGLLDKATRVVGVDLSPQRIERFKANTHYEGIVSDSQSVAQIANNTVDIVLNSMMIEHVANDAALLSEIKRMLKPGGWLYLTTVVKKSGAWYFRRSPDGRWVLDPTHLREYPSRAAVEQLVLEAGFNIAQVNFTQLSFPILHPLLRTANRIIPLRNVNKVFLGSGPLAWIEKIALPIPRYFSIEIAAQAGD